MTPSRPLHRSPASLHTGELRLFDPRRGDLAFRLERLAGAAAYAQPQRWNYFSVIWIQKGSGLFHAGLGTYPFRGPAVLFANPYQIFFIEPESSLEGVVLQFHANFFCLETYHEAVGCNGVLFNDVYGQPLVLLSGATIEDASHLLGQMEREFRTGGLAHSEVLMALLKLFLIALTRAKLGAQHHSKNPVGAPPPLVARLVELIEQRFQTTHAPAAYAAALHVTPKALGKLVKTHFGRTVTELIRERLIKHAKWQLLHTRSSVKEIAWQIGFADELYFSRLFKRVTGFPPSSFREFETAIRAGGNLSM